MPPRHGKSELCSKYLPAWYVCKNPDKRVILASYEADFAAGWGRKAREIVTEHGGSWFGVSVMEESRAVNRWDLAGRQGGMSTTGVGGPMTGKGADLLIVDDPVKNAEEANSQVHRDKAWEWWQSTAYTRLEPSGAAIVVQTRWHQDDLAGRLLASMQTGGEQWRVLKMPAINDDGAALWPERWPIEELERLRTKSNISSYWWSALYQQEPIPPGGEMIQRDWLPIVRASPAVHRAVRYWDKAGSAGKGDYSAGVLMADVSGIYYVLDVIRGQWSSGERNRIMRQTAALDASRYPDLEIWTEQEPGSGGKESAETTIRQLAGYAVYTERVTGDKATRAMPFAAQAEAGNVRIVAGDWNREYIDELTTFPRGRHDDQVDGTSGAFNKLALAHEYWEGPEEYLPL